MSAHLSALDATFLELEEADESAHMHIGGVMVFDAMPCGRPPSREELQEHLESRLAQLPRYRQCLSQPHTGGLSWPQWRDDPTFTVSRHLTRAALPAPGGRDELARWSSEFFSTRLDRHRPLWEMALVEGLADGRWALAHKTHHCMVDGVGSVDVVDVLLDTAASLPTHTRTRRRITGARAADEAAAPTSREDGALGRALASLTHAAEGLPGADTAMNAARFGAHSVRHPREAAGKARAAIELIVREELRGAPHTSLNEPIGTRRRLEVVPIPLADLKSVKSALGGTVNDVVLSLTASGLRALLASRGEPLPAQGLRAMVPMNLRAASEHLALGNRVSSLFVEVPVLEADVVRRYRETTASSRSQKLAGQAQGSSAVLEIAGLAPPVLHAGLARSLYATRLFNLTITNVPGRQHTLYALGAPLREIHPLVPLAAAHALGVAALSYDGNVFLGVVADPDQVPDLEVFLGAVDSSLEELLAAAGAHPTAGVR
ncbi:MAG TPA: wax ester/triacylglycerol synthase family O-acyltransferase [Solirubrobacteraceae bacterium]|nr:wax ester/triacylglycerol synthase family O-acyltransferase [Solirubrobacteraceae bacterium]